MDAKRAEATDAAILAEQLAYYRARAAEYDEWWLRTGRYDHGAELNAAWHDDAARVEQALVAHLDAARPQSALELACGTGLFTRLVAPRVGRLLALDASPEVQAVNRARVSRANVAYEIADLFAWQPAARYDFVFMSFWLSHVPDDRFDEFWTKVRSALADGGSAYVIDSGWDTTSSATNHARPERERGDRGAQAQRRPRVPHRQGVPRSRRPRAAARRARARVARRAHAALFHPRRGDAPSPGVLMMSRDVTADVRNALAPSGTLRAAINFGNAVLAQKDPATNEPRGVSVDIARELASRLGVPLALVTFDAAGKVFEALQGGAWDVAFLAIDPKRAAEIDFTAPYVIIEGSYMVRADSPLARDRGRRPSGRAHRRRATAARTSSTCRARSGTRSSCARPPAPCRSSSSSATGSRSRPGSSRRSCGTRRRTKACA